MKIAWIGTGVMGKRMLVRLLNNGHIVYGYNRTYEKMEDIEHTNFFKCKNIVDAVKSADIIFTMVGYPSDLKNVYLNEINGIFMHANKNAICVDMTTSSPELAKILYDNPWKIKILDAPVSGGEKGAIDGTLSIMVGGDFEIYEKVLPILQILGNSIDYFGAAGSGQNAKLSNQISVGINSLLNAEIINLLEFNKAETTEVLKMLKETNASSWQIDNNGPKILDGDLLPGFFIKHFIKDLNLIRQNGVKNLYGLNQVLKTYEKFVSLEPKNNNLGTQAIYKYFKKEKEAF